MNYAGKFDATVPSAGRGAASHSDVHVETVQGHAPADAIIIPDAQFLFHADFKRSGLDLVLHKDDHELVLHDYFKGDKRAALASPDGAHLNGDIIVNALTGSVEVAQAGAPATAGQVIGHVTKLAGSATAIRNGVSIILNMGDNVEKGDVVQSGSASTVGITFIDGTVFGLSSNARMVLNEMVYDPNGTSNSSLLSLVAGTITFVAGETAKHGDMKVDTPVATMGIRGTAVLVQIDFTIPGQGDTPDAKFQVLVEPDGTTGSYILFDKTTLQPLAVVNQAGQQINISNGVISQSSAPLSPDVQQLITDVFSLKFSANDTNPKTTTAQTDTANPQLTGPVIKLADKTTATPVFQDATATGGSSSPNQISNNPGPTITHFPLPPTVVVLDSHGNPASSFALTELAGQTGDATDHDAVGGAVRFVDINAGDLPTVSVTLDHINYKGALVDGNFQLLSGALSSLELEDLRGTGITINMVPSSTTNNNGSATWTYSLADKAFDFLGAGETLVLTYTVKVDNNYAPLDQTSTATITITITGTNDAPVITSSAQKIAFSGGTDTPGGSLNKVTEGKLNFADVDLDDTHKAAAKLTGWVMSDGSKVPQGLVDALGLFGKAMTASIATDSTGSGNGIIDWKFAALPAYAADFIPAGQTLKLTYTITVTDSQGASAKQTVTVDITGVGSDNPAVVWIHTDGDGSPDNLWSTKQNWETDAAPTASDDVVIITNQLIGLTPSYPVTIDDKTLAFAHSLKMDNYQDYSGLKSPELDNSGSLTISGLLSLSADSIFKNFNTASVGGTADFYDTSQLANSGTVTFGGLATFHDHSVLENSGTLTLLQGGDFADSSSISNDSGGTIEVAGGTLTVSVDVSNLGQMTVDEGAALTLSFGTIDGGEAGGTLNISGTLNLEGVSFLKNGSLANTGQINVSGTVVFDNEAVTNNDSGAIDVTGALTLQDASSITNGEGNTETVEKGASLTLQDVSSIIGGQLINLGTVHVESSTGVTFDGVSVNNSDGTIQVDSAAAPPATLLLDDGTTISGGTLDIGDVGRLEVSTEDGATLSGVTVGNSNLVQVDGGSVLVLDRTTISGGTVNDGATIHVTGDSAIDGATLENGQVNIDADVNLTLDDVTVTGTGFSGAIVLDSDHALTLDNVSLDGTLSNGGTLTIDSENTLTLNDGTITGGSVLNDGIINSTGASAIDGAEITNFGLIAAVSGTLTIDPGTLTNIATLQADGGELDISGEVVANTGTVGATGGGTLKLISSSIDNSGDGGMTVDSGATLDLDNSSILGGTLTLSGTLNNIAGSNVITATIADNGGSIEITGGSLDLAGALSGGVDISGAAILELGATGTSAYAQTTVTFDAGSTGTLILDHAESFTGTVAGLDDNCIDLADISYASSPTVSYANGALSVYVDGVDVANINLTGDYSGVTWVLADDGSAAHGTRVTEEPGSITGLDANGNADQGGALTVSVTDGGAAVTDVTYDWQVSTDGVHWSEANGTNGHSNYTPVGADDGLQLRVSLSFTDSNGNAETSTVSAGTVQQPNLSVTLDSGAAHEGRTIHVTSVTEAGVSVSDVTYDWEISSDGIHWTEANGSNGKSSYIPVAADEGLQLRLVTTIVDDPKETATSDLGVVGPDLLVTSLSSTTAAQGSQITVTGVTDNGAPVSNGVSYSWQVSVDGTHWTEVDTNSSFAPTELDEGLQLRLVTTYVAADGSTDRAVNALGTVQAPTITITVETANGADFVHHDVLAQMGSGSVHPGGSSSFTVIDVAHHVEFVVTGSNFTYHGGEVTGGTITSFEEFTTGATPVALADFTGLSVNAATWMADVKLDAEGVKGPLKALTATFAYDFIGGPGDDSFGIGAPAGKHTTLTGGAGSDLFQYQKGYGAVTITDFDQGDTGTFTQREGDKIELDGFSTKPTITHSNGNTVADFGNGDVLTLLGVNPHNLNHSDFIFNHDEIAGQIDGSPAHFVFNQAGQGPGITLQGTSGDDVIFATGNSDTLTGNGGHDQFVFAPTNGPAAVQHTVTDFNVKLDTIDLRQFTNIGTTAGALATASQHGNDTLLTLDSHDTILLKNVIAANLHASDFIVTPHYG